jgi:hypothetical protein
MKKLPLNPDKPKQLSTDDLAVDRTELAKYRNLLGW